MRHTRLLALVPALALAVGFTAPTAAMTPSRFETQVSFPTRTVTDADGDVLLADRYGRALQLHGANLGKVGDMGVMRCTTSNSPALMALPKRRQTSHSKAR